MENGLSILFCFISTLSTKGEEHICQYKEGTCVMGIFINECQHNIHYNSTFTSLGVFHSPVLLFFFSYHLRN